MTSTLNACLCLLLAVAGGCVANTSPVPMSMSIASSEQTVEFSRQVRMPGSDDVLWAIATPFLGSDQVETVYWTRDSVDRPALGLTLTAEGAGAMERATSANHGRFILIELDAQPISAPRIMGTISGHGVISAQEQDTPALVAFARSMGVESPPHVVAGKGLRVP